MFSYSHRIESFCFQGNNTQGNQFIELVSNSGPTNFENTLMPFAVSNQPQQMVTSFIPLQVINMQTALPSGQIMTIANSTLHVIPSSTQPYQPLLPSIPSATNHNDTQQVPRKKTTYRPIRSRARLFTNCNDPPLPQPILPKIEPPIQDELFLGSHWIKVATGQTKTQKVLTEQARNFLACLPASPKKRPAVRLLRMNCTRAASSLGTSSK